MSVLLTSRRATVTAGPRRTIGKRRLRKTALKQLLADEILLLHLKSQVQKKNFGRDTHEVRQIEQIPMIGTWITGDSSTDAGLADVGPMPIGDHIMKAMHASPAGCQIRTHSTLQRTRSVGAVSNAP